MRRPAIVVIGALVVAVAWYWGSTQADGQEPVRAAMPADEAVLGGLAAGVVVGSIALLVLAAAAVGHLARRRATALGDRDTNPARRG
jgi:hypothetical protein